MIKRESDIENLKSIDFEEIRNDILVSLYSRYKALSNSQIEYLTGMGACAGATMVTYPINKVIFRQSLWGFDFERAIRQLRIEGLTKLYRGSLPPLITKSIGASIMFGAFNQYYTFIQQARPFGQDLFKNSDTTAKFIAGMGAGFTEALFMPFERIQMLLQDGRLNNRYRNTIHVIVALRKHGLGEYYRGWTAVLLRNGPTTFLYFGLKDPLYRAVAATEPLQLQSPTEYIKPKSILEWREFTAHFISGAILGMVISTISFPLNVVRIHMQTQEIGTERVGAWRTFRRLYLDEKNRIKLVSGIHANAARSILYWGCITVFSEALRQHFHAGL